MESYYDRVQQALTGKRADLAFMLSQRGVAAGEAKCKFSYGRLLLTGQGCEKDEEKGIKILQEVFPEICRMSAEGDMQARKIEGYYYYCGYGVQVDIPRAVSCFYEAAEGGEPSAQAHYALLLRCGHGVEKDPLQALIWYKKAAAQGYGYAQNAIAMMYEEGEGVAVDMQEALKWYALAAENGYISAQYNLGVKYLNGIGVTKDVSLGLAWLKKAAAVLPQAQYNLALAYLFGEQGVPKDEEEGARYLFRAAQGGLQEAQTLLNQLQKQ